jgi:uncharacterized membrane protein YcaP (DUF421 family)
MDSVLRALLVYGLLLLVFRIAGRRALSETTTFDLVLLLIISETVQQAMVANDNSLTNGALLVLTLVGANLAISFLKLRSPGVARWIDRLPVVVVREGQVDRHSMNCLRIDEEDVMEAARLLHGLERLDQVKHAVVERDGEISIVPR